MSSKPLNRILHVDGDSFFASCQIALNQELTGRTTIYSSTTLPYDEPDYEAALTFALSDATRMTGH